MYQLLLSEPAVFAASVLLGRYFFPDTFLKLPPNKKDKKALPASADVAKKKLGELLNDLTVEDFVTLINKQMSANANKAVKMVNTNIDAIYTEQLAKAQDFVNGDTSINIHALRELLRDLLPERYSEAIKKIKPGQSVKTIINVLGGNNQIVPNATKVEQNMGR